MQMHILLAVLIVGTVGSYDIAGMVHTQDAEANRPSESEILAFVVKLNGAATDKPCPASEGAGEAHSDDSVSPAVGRLCELLRRLKDLTLEHKPEDYPDCRFGSKAHTAWLEAVNEMWDDIAESLGVARGCPEALKPELKQYLMNSFGNQMRIDYGTGHETQFTCFLKGMYDAGLLTDADLTDVVGRVMSRYFLLVHHLIDRYNLEPAGSKGAWGIDHYQFLPFLLGSAQLLSTNDILPEQAVENGSCAPLSERYIFLQALDYIKKKVGDTPLEISSPMLHNICSTCTWRKINEGLLKMYESDLENIARVKHCC